MDQLLPTFVFSYERGMVAIREEEYARCLLAENNWWSKVIKTRPIETATERLTWFLNTASIEPVGRGGNMPFSPLVTQTTELVPQTYASAISVRRDQLLDLRNGVYGGEGLDILAEWSRQVGYASAYDPQFRTAEFLMNGANTDGSANAYDGLPFFADYSAPHPVNPYNTSVGTPTLANWQAHPGAFYANWLHGAAQGSTPYPGALPIDESVTLDVAFKNLSKAIAYSRAFKMPDGSKPRMLNPAAIICPPALTTRVSALTGAYSASGNYVLPFGASSGGGSATVDGMIRRWGLAEPIEAPELASSTNYSTQIMIQATDGSGNTRVFTETITGNDTSWYLVMKQTQTSELGGLIYTLREPFRMNLFTGDGEAAAPVTGLDAILNRSKELEYHAQGRYSVQPGHPYLILRIDAS
jgi:phage major head subunit gpT-like protein